ncbi:hypothetical protein B0O80DRAFT_428062 [Mortierella sp. GBAus27b]|nr:hypothetical protein B0O80DRAFT_428062 [Mortierella sp. GBAus27b]
MVITVEGVSKVRSGHDDVSKTTRRYGYRFSVCAEGMCECMGLGLFRDCVEGMWIVLLADQSVTYDSFDILEDDDIRQGLKTHVDWPTFPMVFFKGELLGGLDVVTEMVENGEFSQVTTEVTS